MNELLVLALGGNALGNSPKEQLDLVKKTAHTIVDLVEEGYSVLVGHGNGPQVGTIHLGLDLGRQREEKIPEFDFPECGAMSQGYIGYHLQQALGNEFKRRGITKKTASIITQVLVKEDDSAFSTPTKPVGSFYTKEESEKISKEKGYRFIEDANRGYRRVVPSPSPVTIVELPVISALLKEGILPLAVGGGGVPVVETATGYHGIGAVIDKDKSLSKLATDLKADKLIILTAVDQVFLHYNTPEEKALSSITVKECETFIQEGHFAEGSMLPKVEACMDFVKQNPEGKALITSLSRASEALKGKTGTIIVK